MTDWVVVAVPVALVAAPSLFIQARRASIRRAAESIERIHAAARREALAHGPSTPRVTIKYHTYSGFLLHAVETEHYLELPYPVALSTLEALLRHNLTHGLLAEGVLLVPVLGFISYLGQKRSIRRQLEGRSRAPVARPRPGESAFQKWGGAAMILFCVMGACSVGMGQVREAAANRTPLPMSCSDLVAQAPANRWVRVSGVSGALQAGAVRFTKGVPDRVYVPLRCGDTAGPVRLVLATGDRALVQAVPMRAPREDLDATVILPLTTPVSARVTRDVQGMVRRAKDHETQTTIGGGLEGGGCIYCPVKIRNLAADYAVIEEGAAPSLLGGLALLAGAAVGAAYLWRRLRVSR